MRMNVARKFTERTHEGAPAARATVEQQLRRSVMSCLLWESEFYEDGQAIAERIVALADHLPGDTVVSIALEARGRMNLRHVPMLLVSTLAKRSAGNPLVADAVEGVVQRADELTELLAIYWRDGRKPIPAQFKKGLRRAFAKFDAYQLAKYDRANAVRLRDVLRIVHPKPANDEQAKLWKGLLDGTIESPDTWEVALSGGADKKEAFERLLREDRLGYLALLRNLRNMATAGVDTNLVREKLLARKGARRVLPFRYVAAARAAPQFEPWLDQALCEAILEMPALPGKTAVMVDVSGSMRDKLSAKSDMTRMDAAAALASIVNGDVRMFSFADQVVEVPPRRGMAGVDAIVRSQSGGTRLFDAVAAINANVEYDRLIVITDEQATDPSRFGYWIRGQISTLPNPKTRGYMINVASAKNGVGYGRWTHIDGFSEGVLRYIVEAERGT